jgi:hypothetical protein
MNLSIPVPVIILLLLALCARPVAGAFQEPPEASHLDSEAQEAYIERLARESLEEKIATGKTRYEQRMRYKQAMIASLRHDAQQRQIAIAPSIVRPHSQLAAPPRRSSIFSFTTIAVIAIAAAFAFLLYRHFPKPRPKRP